MGNDSDKPESGAGEAKPPKTKAEDNPWYLLATLYGERGGWRRNQRAWNRYIAARLDEKTRTRLIEGKRYQEQELTPFSPEELHEIEAAFAKRKSSAREMSLPASGSEIDFSNTEFDRDVSFDGYVFTQSTFQSATFSGEAHFYGATFSGTADFNGATFSGEANFDGATFSRGADFNGATFSGKAIFSGATFPAGADFNGATFSAGAYFSDATFSGSNASFDGATFSGTAHFSGAAFSAAAHFSGASFSVDAYFSGATYSGMALFGCATFSARAAFNGATFSAMAYFNGATFFGDASFDGAKFQTLSSFVNAEMKDTTSFEGAIFKTEPPKFFGAKLHQGTVWRGITWPPLPENKDEAGDFIDAYACLKLEMDRLKKHEDELDFFALELQSRRVLLGRWGRGLPIALYGLVSDYGRSYARPLYALFMVAAIGTLVLSISGALSSTLAPWQSLGLSFANTFNVFGFRKDFFDPHLFENLPALLKILAALQTILGTILLFLFGLGIRNKFRIK